jgi:hypothetical protein
MIKSIEYKYGSANVLYREGKARPYQITVKPAHDMDAPSRMVSLKTEEAVIQRLNADHEAVMQDVKEKRSFGLSI